VTLPLSCTVHGDTYMHTKYIAMCISCCFINTDVTINLKPHVQINITQSMDLPMIESFRMYLTCMASVNKGNYHVDIKWSGKGLKSLWITQLQVMKQGKLTMRKLYFHPWLDSHAGNYTCHVNVKDTDNSELIVNKTFTVNGMHCKSCSRLVDMCIAI